MARACLSRSQSRPYSTPTVYIYMQHVDNSGPGNEEQSAHEDLVSQLAPLVLMDGLRAIIMNTHKSMQLFI